MFVFIIKILLYLPLSILQFFDDLRDKKQGKLPLRDRYGMECFCGLAGSGKTTSLVRELLDYRKKYKNDVLIFTNFPCSVSDFVFTSYTQLVHNFNKPVIVGWDELPNDFYKNGFKDFPEDLLRKLTQLRKGNGMKILYTCQDITLVDVAFRRLTFFASDCHTFKGRLTYYTRYRIDWYFNKNSSVSVENKVKIPTDKFRIFFQTKTLRNSFDSFRIVS